MPNKAKRDSSFRLWILSQLPCTENVRCFFYFWIYLSGKHFVWVVFIGEGENQQLFMGHGGHTRVKSAGSQTGLSRLLISLLYLFHQGSSRFTQSAVWRWSRSTVAHQRVCVCEREGTSYYGQLTGDRASASVCLFLRLPWDQRCHRLLWVTAVCVCVHTFVQNSTVSSGDFRTSYWISGLWFQLDPRGRASFGVLARLLL